MHPDEERQDPRARQAHARRHPGDGAMTGTRLAVAGGTGGARARRSMMLAVAVGVGQGRDHHRPVAADPGVPAWAGEARAWREGREPRARRAAPPARASEWPGRRRPELWLLLLAPVAVLVLLVWLVAYARSGPPTAYGYALGNEPRKRRRVPAWVITLLTRPVRLQPPPRRLRAARDREPPGPGAEAEAPRGRSRAAVRPRRRGPRGAAGRPRGRHAGDARAGAARWPPRPAPATRKPERPRRRRQPRTARAKRRHRPKAAKPKAKP